MTITKAVEQMAEREGNRLQANLHKRHTVRGMLQKAVLRGYTLGHKAAQRAARRNDPK